MEVVLDNVSFEVDRSQPSVYMRQLRRLLGLKRRISQQGQLLKEVKMTIPFGTLTAVVGSPGAGISLLMKVMAQEIRPTSGRVTYPCMGKVLPTLAFVGTERRLLPLLTVAETVHFAARACNPPQYGASVLHRDIETPVLDMLFLHRQRDVYVSQLSDGEYLRVVLACALCAHPRVLLIDSKVLDRNAFEHEQFMKALRKLADAGTTILWGIDRDMDQAKAFDNVIVMAAGSVLYAGEAAKSVSYLAKETETPELKTLDDVLRHISYVEHQTPLPGFARGLARPDDAPKRNGKGYTTVPTDALEMEPMAHDDGFDEEEEDKMPSFAEDDLKSRFSLTVDSSDDKKKEPGVTPSSLSTELPPAVRFSIDNLRAKHNAHPALMKTSRRSSVPDRTPVLSHSIGCCSQWTMIAHRFAVTSWREDVGTTVLMLAACAALIFGIWQRTELSQMGVVDQLARFLFMSLFVSSIVSHALVPFWVQHAQVFVREQRADMYHPLAFAAAQSLWSMTQTAAVTLLFVLPTTMSVMYDWQAGQTALACTLFVLHAWAHSALVEAIAMVTRSELRTHIYAMTAAFASFMLGGYVVPYADMTTGARAMATFSYTEHALRALVRAQAALGLVPAPLRRLCSYVAFFFFRCTWPFRDTIWSSKCSAWDRRHRCWRRWDRALACLSCVVAYSPLPCCGLRIVIVWRFVSSSSGGAGPLAPAAALHFISFPRFKFTSSLLTQASKGRASPNIMSGRRRHKAQRRLSRNGSQEHANRRRTSQHRGCRQQLRNVERTKRLS
jgi:ABC-type multidrug transport system ATPase subunit